MKKALAVWFLLMLTSCTAGRDYQRSLMSLLDYDFITTNKDYQKVLDSWLGYDIEILVQRWGYPTDNYELKNRNIIYVFNRSDGYQNTSVKKEISSITNKFCADEIEPCLNQTKILTTMVDNSYETYFKKKYLVKAGFTSFSEYASLAYDHKVENPVLDPLCETIFEVDPDNRIIYWSYHGDDCY